MTLTIKTNNAPRPIVNGYELSPKERAEFDYLSDERLDESSFFRFKGNVYDLGEFMRCSFNMTLSLDEPNVWGKWDGYSSDSYFSGVVVRYVDSHERVIVGRYFS